jgi:hypothetical protein
MINKLQNYFDIILYFVTNKDINKSIANLIELYKLEIRLPLKIINQTMFNKFFINSLNTDNLFLVTSIPSVFNNEIVFKEEYYKSILQIGHGIDEEMIILNKKNNNNNNLINLQLNASLYSPKYKEIINNIYKLDSTKRTLVFFETTSIWIFKRFSPVETDLIKIQNNIIETLLELKKEYNIILRFHPQDSYTIFANSIGLNHCTESVIDNFIVDYTQIPVFNLYEIADVIITSRFSASGYQSLFIKDKNVIFLESDFETRKKYTKDGFIHTHSSNNLELLKSNNKIVSNKEVPIVHENKFVYIFDALKIDSKKLELNKDIFIKKIYGIDRTDFETIVNNQTMDIYLKNIIKKN